MFPAAMKDCLDISPTVAHLAVLTSVEIQVVINSRTSGRPILHAPEQLSLNDHKGIERE
jgi:hypothetical protein